MPHYHRLGKIPPKRHTQFRQADGTLYAEELFGTEGFSGNYSNIYYHYAPTQVKKIEAYGELQLEEWDPGVHRHVHFKTDKIKRQGDAVLGRQPLLFNKDVVMSIARPSEPMNYFYRNAECDEVYFVHDGQGTLETNFGLLPYHEGDYIVIPRGTTFRFDIAKDSPNTRFLVIEARGNIAPPRRYQNNNGQLLDRK